MLIRENPIFWTGLTDGTQGWLPTRGRLDEGGAHRGYTVDDGRKRLSTSKRLIHSLTLSKQKVGGVRERKRKI